MKWVTALLALSLVILLSSTTYGSKLEGMFSFFSDKQFSDSSFSCADLRI